MKYDLQGGPCVWDLFNVCQLPKCIVYNSNLHSEIHVMCSALLSLLSRPPGHSLCDCVEIVFCYIYNYVAFLNWTAGLYCRAMLNCFIWLKGKNGKMMTTVYVVVALTITVWSIHTHLFIQLIYNIAALV